ncbi:hypothetical protein TNIN_106711 [Trichonephila inaurata madagascariensis]|uniref:DUF4817 domain-containing protein n=1 Tax=Trichonephila inaurata madagascariensis TaxID=2747483 RepID=A0A8X6JYG4_9ARAC|nr:hypothetical protein TNIN_106711 [Trichonephila inaurata madagascariensis]
MLSLEERIFIVSWKLGGKTYEQVRYLYLRKYRKRSPTRTKDTRIRLLVNKFRRTGSVVDEKCPGRPSTSNDTAKSLYLNFYSSSLILDPCWWLFSD